MDTLIYFILFFILLAPWLDEDENREQQEKYKKMLYLLLGFSTSHQLH